MMKATQPTTIYLQKTHTLAWMQNSGMMAGKTHKMMRRKNETNPVITKTIPACHSANSIPVLQHDEFNYRDD